MAEGFNSPKLIQHIGDGFEYMKNHESAFDVIITDSSDPVGKCIYSFIYSGPVTLLRIVLAYASV